MDNKQTASVLLERGRSFLQKERGVASVIAFFYACGILGHGLSYTQELMSLLTPWFLLVAGLLVVVPFWKETGTKGRVWFFATYLITYLLEVIGVATGSVFGAYEYGPVLGFHLLEVPLIIGFNWVLVIIGFIRGAQWLRFRLPCSGVFETLAPAAAALLFDYIMEPIAIGLEYWRWDGVAVPLQNYIAWFLIAFAAAAAFRLLRIKLSAYLPFYYTCIQLFFFLGLYVAT